MNKFSGKFCLKFHNENTCVVVLMKALFVSLILYVPVNNFSVMLGRVLLG